MSPKFPMHATMLVLALTLLSSAAALLHGPALHGSASLLSGPAHRRGNPIVLVSADSSLAALINTACAKAAPPNVEDNGETELRLQNELLGVFTALASDGRLRAFGSCAGVLPAPEPRSLPPDAQLRLTGLPTTAFAPPASNSLGDVAVGLGGAGLLAAAALVLQVDYRMLAGAIAAILVADRAVFKGLLQEGVTRALRPEYRRTVAKHEAGHLLVAVLLGCPVQNVVLDPIAALRDGRFSGVAGTVFFDPQLGEGMRKGTITRESIDRFSVIVMAGLASEAMLNGRALGGQSDEQALVSLLASLDGGRTWDLGRIQNQARWGASQALLLLREHRPLFDALVAQLERGCSVGECVAAIEAAVVPAYGRNGEMPGETRRRKLMAAERDAAAAAAVVPPPPLSGVVTPSGGGAAMLSSEAAARELEIAKRLKAIDSRLAELPAPDAPAQSD